MSDMNTVDIPINLGSEDCLEIFYWMKLTREVDKRSLDLFKQGKIPGVVFSQLGHEAVSVGAGYALRTEDVVAPMHRDLGTYLLRGMTPGRVFAQAMGRVGSPSRGRDTNTHGMGDISLGIIGYVSHLPQSLPVALGAAFSFQYWGEERVALTFVGDGGTSAGAFHETLNMAAVLKLPLIVVIENNQYAYSTPTRHQYTIEDLSDRAAGYGIPGIVVDGNDVLAMWQAVKQAATIARRGDGPSLIEAKTMRMQGHAVHDQADYVPRDLLRKWGERDPLLRFSQVLRKLRIYDDAIEDEMSARIKQEVDEAVKWAASSPLPEANSVTEGVYARANLP